MDDVQAAGAADPTPEIAFSSYRPGDDRAIVAVLNACQEGAWGDEALWRWKHRERPGFNPADVVVARKGGEVVGCFHGAVLELKLEEGFTVPMSYDGDFAVIPAYRGRDLAVRAHDRSGAELRARHVVFRGGFTSRELNAKLYHRRFGYVFVPGVTTQFRKYLGPGPLVPRVADLGERLLSRPALRRALSRPLTVDLVIAGFPACHVVLTAAGFRLERGPAVRADLRARMSYLLLTSFAGGEAPGPGTLLHAIGRGELRIGGLVRSAPRLFALALALLRR